jgi:AcrR family transcriptional regulator
MSTGQKRMSADLFNLSAEEASPDTAGERIFQAARELFYQQGIRAVSVDAIAAAAGTTKMSLYRNFGSKDQLVAAVLEEQDRLFWEWWDETIAPYEGDPRRQVDCLFREFEVIASDADSCRGCPIANASVEIIDPSSPARLVVVRHHEETLARLRKLSAAMGARNPEQLGDALMLLMGGSFLSRLCFDDLGPVQSVAGIATQLIDLHTSDIAEG